MSLVMEAQGLERSAKSNPAGSQDPAREGTVLDPHSLQRVPCKALPQAECSKSYETPF